MESTEGQPSDNHFTTDKMGEETVHEDQDGSSSLEPRATNPPMTITREIFLVFTICCAQVVTQGGFAQALINANIIAESFGTEDTAQLSWFSASYTLTAGTFILVAGRIGDIWGYRNVLSAGYLWFALWTLLAGVSVYTRSIAFFDLCRAMQGIGGALCIPNAIAIIGSVYPDGKRKNIVFALFGAATPNGWIVSAAFSALLAQRAWWPWAFWLLAIVCVALAASVLVVVPGSFSGATDTSDTSSPSSPASKIARPTWQRFDLLGSAVGVAGLTLFNVAWNQAPVTGWREPYVIAFLVLGTLLCAAFFRLERRSGVDPILPTREISRQAAFVCVILALGWASFGQALFYWLEFAQELRRLRPLSVVAQMTPITVAGLVAAMTAGVLMAKVHVSYLFILASLGFCAGNIIYATLPVHQSYWLQAFWSFVIMPWGMDVSFPAAAVTMSSLVPAHQQGMAASLIATIINYSISIGLGIAGTAASQIDVDLDDENSLLAKFRAAFYTGIGLSGCAVLVSIYFSFESQRAKRR